MEAIQEWMDSVVLYAAQNPWQFIYYILLVLSPFFFISAMLSWKLAKHIEQQEKDKKKKAKRESNIAKIKRAKAD